MHRPLLALLFLATALLAQESHEIVTAHYRLHAEGPPGEPGQNQETEEFGRVLEAAWPQFKKRWGGEPKLKLKNGERLNVHFLETREAWEAAIKKDGGTPPAAGGYYWPESKSAYLYRQPSAYYTRTLLLHECAHQFHFLVRTRNKSPIAAWYSEGIVEHVAAHTWDGSRLVLGAMPVLSLEDYAARALETVRTEGFDLASFVDGDMGENRPLGWALVRYLDTEMEKKFSPLARKYDGGNVAGPLFRKMIGNPKTVQGQFVEWLAKNQEPWSPVHVDWQGMAPDRILGKGKGTCVCRVKAPLELLDATLEIPAAKKWKAGVMLHYTSKEDWSVLLIDWAGFLDIKRWEKDRFQILEQGQGPGPTAEGSYHIQLFRRGDKVFASMGTVSFGPWELPGQSFGLALDSCEVSFRALSWK